MIRILLLIVVFAGVLAGCGSGEVQGHVTPEAKRTEESSKAANATQGTPESVTANP